MIYVVDIDNTICKTIGSDYLNSVPHLDRIDKINQLYDEGHTIIYYTARGGTTGIDWTNHTMMQLQKWNCKYNELRMKKLSYDVWIDDKATNSEDYFK